MPFAISGGSNVGSAQIIDNEIINDDINDAAGIVYSKLDLANSINSNDFTDATLKIAAVTVTAAELKALNPTSKTLIAAPGAGKYIAIEDCFIAFDYVAPQYTGGNDLLVCYSSESANYFALTTETLQIRGAADFVQSFQPANVGYVYAKVNEAVQLKNTGANFATGNGTMKIHIKYRIITI